MEGEKGAVCVTGGTGHVASWLIMKLLQLGYSVRATVRSNSDVKKKIGFLRTLPSASEKLEIFNADLDKPSSFDAAIGGCIGVFHLAHPMDYEGEEAEEAVVKRSMEGTLGILKACLNSKTVKRVIYTSSAAAVALNNKGLDVMDENAWSDIECCRAFSINSSYAVSKTVTERAALEFAEEHGLDLVTLCPSLVVGPFICPNFPISVRMGLSLIFGDGDQYKGLSQTQTCMVHIEDVAAAHIFLLECPKVEGRFICSSIQATAYEIAQYFAIKYPEFQMPSLDLSREIENVRLLSLSSKKLLDLGFKFKYGLEEMFDEAIECCREKGFL